MQTNQARWAIIGACVGLLLALGWLDYRTGYELGFFIFYSIPVSITAWYAGRFPAILMSLASALVWLIADSYTGQKYSSLFLVYWNIAVRCGSFVINAFTVSKIRRIMDQQKQMKIDLDSAQEDARKLRGLLPACAVCQSPRVDMDYQHEVAAYLQAVAQTQSDSWRCPACTASSGPPLHQQSAQ